MWSCTSKEDNKELQLALLTAYKELRREADSFFFPAFSNDDPLLGLWKERTPPYFPHSSSIHLQRGEEITGCLQIRRAIDGGNPLVREEKKPREDVPHFRRIDLSFAVEDMARNEEEHAHSPLVNGVPLSQRACPERAG